MNSFKYLAMLLSVIATGAIVAGDSGRSYEERQPAYKTQPARSRHYARQQAQNNQQMSASTRNEALQQDRSRQDGYVTRRDYNQDRYDRRNDRRHVGDSRVWPWNWGRNRN